MSNKFHNEPFDESTKLKLEIFGECFREWFPVFIHNPFAKKVYIYDFFAGMGKDCENTSGSPLILLSEAKGENCKNCKSVSDKDIHFVFNDKKMHEVLKKNSLEYIDNCKQTNCKKLECIYKIYYESYDFKDIFAREKFKKILNNNDYAKFILLDQFGFSQVDESVFKELIKAPKTDSIFFISTSFIDRFKRHENTKKYIDTSKIDFDNVEPRQRHKLIAKYFEQFIGKEEEYYIHHFTIKKGSNYYGLIFGSKHTLGMEKFLKVCWKKDKFSGESSEGELHNHDFSEGSLFFIENSSNKIEDAKYLIRSKILRGEIQDNISGLKFALKLRCEPKIFVDVISELNKTMEIKIISKFNKKATNIHDIIKENKKYLIQLKNENNKN